MIGGIFGGIKGYLDRLTGGPDYITPMLPLPHLFQQQSFWRDVAARQARGYRN